MPRPGSNSPSNKRENPAELRSQSNALHRVHLHKSETEAERVSVSLMHDQVREWIERVLQARRDPGDKLLLVDGEPARDVDMTDAVSLSPERNGYHS